MFLSVVLETLFFTDLYKTLVGVGGGRALQELLLRWPTYPEVICFSDQYLGNSTLLFYVPKLDQVVIDLR